MFALKLRELLTLAIPASYIHVTMAIVSVKEFTSARFDRLRLDGVQSLRVADASVFRNNVSGNIISLVYAVAGKAADLIKKI